MPAEIELSQKQRGRTWRVREVRGPRKLSSFRVCSCLGALLAIVSFFVLIGLVVASSACFDRLTSKEPAVLSLPPTVPQAPVLQPPSSSPPSTPLPPQVPDPCAAVQYSCTKLERLQAQWSALESEYHATGDVNARGFMHAVWELQSINPPDTIMHNLLEMDIRDRLNHFNNSIHEQEANGTDRFTASERANLTLKTWIESDPSNDTPLLTLGWIFRDLDTPCIMLYELLLSDTPTNSSRDAYEVLLNQSLRHEVNSTSLGDLKLYAHVIDIPRSAFIDAACEMPGTCEHSVRSRVEKMMESMLAVTGPLRAFVNQQFDAKGFTSTLPMTCQHGFCCKARGLPSPPTAAPEGQCSMKRNCPMLSQLVTSWLAIEAQYHKMDDVSAAEFLNASAALFDILPESFRPIIEEEAMSKAKSIRDLADQYFDGFDSKLTIREILGVWKNGPNAYPLSTFAKLARMIDGTCIVVYETMLSENAANTTMANAWQTAIQDALQYEEDQSRKVLFNVATITMASGISRSDALNGFCPNILPVCEPELASKMKELLAIVLAVMVPLRSFTLQEFDSYPWGLNHKGEQILIQRTCLHSACCEGEGFFVGPPHQNFSFSFLPLVADRLRDVAFSQSTASCEAEPSANSRPQLPPLAPSPPSPPAPAPPKCEGGRTGFSCHRCFDDASCASLTTLNPSRCDHGLSAAYWAVGEEHKGMDCDAGDQLRRISTSCTVHGQWLNGRARGNCTLTAEVESSDKDIFVDCIAANCEFEQRVAGVKCESVHCAEDLSQGRVSDESTAAFAASVSGKVDVRCSERQSDDDSLGESVVSCFVDIATLPVELEAGCQVSRCIDATKTKNETDFRMEESPREKCKREQENRFPGACYCMSLIAIGLIGVFAGFGHIKSFRGPTRRPPLRKDLPASIAAPLSTRQLVSDEAKQLPMVASEALDTSSSHGDLFDLMQKIMPLERPSVLRWDQLIVSSNDKEVVARTSAVLNGGCTALMGPSGSGKTSLLTSVTGLYTAGLRVEGQVQLNDQPIQEWPRGTISLVPQDDILPVELTARETLVFACSLGVPAASKEDRLLLVDAVLTKLHLVEISCNLIGGRLAGGSGLSGGERKRVSIAVSLVTCPRVLFLDEPSSGLDAFRAYELGGMLKSLAARTKRVVLLSVHQPSSQLFELFDGLVLLAEGKTRYHGPPVAAVPHLCPETKAHLRRDPNVAPADHLLHILVTHELEIPSWQPVADDAAAVDADGVHVSAFQHGRSWGDLVCRWARESVWIGWRCLAQVAREPSLLRTQLLVHILVGLFMGAAFHNVTADVQGFQNKAGSVSFILFFLSIGGLSTAQTVTREWPLLWAEYNKGLFSAMSYCLIRLLLELFVLRVLPCVAFGGFFYGLAGLRREATAFAHFLIATSLASADAALVAVGIAACAPQSTGATTLVATMILFVFLLFNGFLLNISTLPSGISWLPHISYAKFATEIILTSELEGELVEVNMPPTPGAPPPPKLYVRANTVLELTGLKVTNTEIDFVSLVLFFLVMMVLTVTIVLIQLHPRTVLACHPANWMRGHGGGARIRSRGQAVRRTPAAVSGTA